MVADLPVFCPPVLLIQHMPAHFTTAFAARLNETCSLRVLEAAGGEELQPGHAYLTPGDYHLLLRRHGSGYRLALDQGPRAHFQRPALDTTFGCVADLVDPQAIGVICTGMGKDGADGLLAMRQAGARSLGQDEASCVVYGMPKAAYDNGAVERQVAIGKMAEAIGQLVRERSRTTAPGRSQS